VLCPTALLEPILLACYARAKLSPVDVAVGWFLSNNDLPLTGSSNPINRPKQTPTKAKKIPESFIPHLLRY